MSSPFAAAKTVKEPPATVRGACVSLRAAFQSRIGEILGSPCRRADLPFAIGLARLKMTVPRLALAALVGLLALVLAVLAILFLYAGALAGVRFPEDFGVRCPSASSRGTNVILANRYF